MRVPAILLTFGVFVCGGGSAASSPVRVDLAISCNETTNAVQQITLPFTLQNARGKVCLDRSTFVRGLEIANSRVWRDDKANVWWLIVQFVDSAAPLVKDVTSRAKGHELALVRGKKVVASGLVTSVPNESQYAVTTESEEEAHKLTDALR